MKQRFFAAFLLALLMALGTSAQALADEISPEENFVTENGDSLVFQSGSFSGPQSIPGDPSAIAESWENEARAVVYNGLKNCAASIDVRSLGIPVSGLGPFYTRLLNDYPELFYVRSSWSYSYNPTNNVVTVITPKYVEFDNLNQAISEFDAAANRALAQVQGLTDPVEKALILHDYLVVNCLYNWEVATGQEAGNAYVASGMPWNAYGALVKGDAVCQGYALAYKYLLTRAGIPSVVISSSSMNHAWNGVQINGKWYHVDCTWDDPTPDVAGYCRHTYFLLSDTSFPSNDHYSWEQIVICNDASYTSGYAFNNCRLPFYRWNGNFYYVKPLTTGEWQNFVYKTPQLDQEGRQLPGDLGLTAYSGAAWVEGRLYLVPSAYSNGPNQRVLMVYDLDTEIAAQAGLFPYVPSDSPDGKVDKNNDWNPGVRYNEGTGEIEIVSPTRRQVVYSVPAASLSSGWAGAQAGTSGAGVAPGLSPDGAAAVLWGSGSSLPSGLTLWAAFYNGSGKLLKYQMIDSAAIARANISNVRPGMVLAYLDPPSGYASVKLMLLTADRAPLCAAG
nr:transglutaminase domain-containing protein [uncultured Oscillibacter sp.]